MLVHPPGAAGEFHRVRLAEHPALESNSYEVLKVFVGNGMGMTVLPMLSVMSEIGSGKLTTVPLKHAALAGTVASLVVRHGRKLPAAATEFLKILQEGLGHSASAMSE
jgi:DNA-binding transcriptional LysR family regulator